MIGSGMLADMSELQQTTMLYCQRDEVLVPGTTWPIEFTAKGERVGNRRSFAFAAAGKPLDGGWATEITQSELTVVQTVDLGVTKTASPNPVNAGDMVTYTMVVTNHSTDVAAPSVVLIDALPAANNLEVSTVPGGCSRSGTTVTCEVGALAAGAQKTIAITGRVLQSSGTQINDVTVKLGDGVTSVKETKLDNNKASVTVNVTPVIKLAATKTMEGSTGKIVAGQSVTMKLGAKNTGVVTADNVIVTDTVPAHFTDVKTSDNRCTVGAYSASTGTSISCLVGTLTKDQDQSGAFLFTMKSQESTTALSGTNTAKVSASKPANVDQLLLTDAVVAYTIHPLQPMLSIGKSKKASIGGKWRDDIPATWNDKLQSTITVKNDGQTATAAVPKLDASGNPRVITVTEQLGRYEKYTGYQGVGWACTDPAGAMAPMTVICRYTLTEDLAIGAALPVLLIDALAEGTGTQSITNTVSVDQVVAGLPPATYSATLKGVPGTAGLGLGKTGQLNQPDSSDPTKDTIVYTLTIKNDGPNAASGVKVVDTLPMWFKPKVGDATKVTVDVSGAPAGTTCPKKAVTDPVVECTLGMLSNGATASIKITVGRPFDVTKLSNTFSVSSVDTQIPNEGTESPGGAPGTTPTALADVTVSQVIPPSTPMQVGVASTFRTDFANLGANAADTVVVRQSVDLSLMDAKNPRLSDGNAGICSVESGTPLSNSFVVCKMTRSLIPNEGLQMLVELTPKFGDAYGNLALDKTCTAPAGRMARMALDRSECADYLSVSTIETSTKQSDTTNDKNDAIAKVKKESVDLLITIEDNYGSLVQDPSPLNGEVKYELIVSNKGPSIATNVSFYLKGIPPEETGFSMESVSFPAGLACLPMTPAGGEWAWKCALTDDGGVLEANKNKKFILPFKVAASDNVAESLSGFKTYALKGKVFSSETYVGAEEGGIASDSNPSNNETTQKTVVVPRAVLKVEKSVNPDTVTVSQPFEYLIKVSNTGPSAAAKVVVKDTLDGNLELVPGGKVSSTLNGVCTTSGQTVTCELPLVKKDEMATVTIPVRVKLGYTGTLLKNKALAGPTVDKEGIPSFLPKEPVETPEVKVSVQPSTLSGKVVVAPPHTDLSTNPDFKSWPPVPASDVSITLKGKDKWGNDVEITTPKINGGSFSFEGIPPSDGNGYTITQKQPTGYLDYKDFTPVGTVPTSFAEEGKDDSITKVVVPDGGKVEGIVFAEVKPGSISGNTFQDMDGDGVRNASKDQQLSAQTITLKGRDYTGAEVSVPVQKTVNGAYKFDKLKPGSYTVEVTSSTALTYIGASVAAVKQADTTSTSIAVNLGSEEQKAEHNFGFQTSGGAGARSISGRVFVEGGSEPGIAGVKITLSGKTSNGVDICLELGAARCTVTTAADGSYVFPELPLSDATGYTVVQEAGADNSAYPLNDYADGTTRKSGSPNVVVENNKFSKIVLDDATKHGSFDFGERLYSLAGKVEAVSKPEQEAFNKPLEGVKVYITGTSGTGAQICAAPSESYTTLQGSKPCQVTTDDKGVFKFPDLPAGSYQVVEVQPAGYGSLLNKEGSHGGKPSNAASDSTSSKIDTVKLQPKQVGGSVDAVDYLFQESANTLSGWVYIDTDNNGDRSGNEPGIGDVTVTLVDKNNPSKSYETKTKPDGSFSFSGIPDGDYDLVESQPSGYLDGRDKAGTGGGKPSTEQCNEARCNTISDIKLSGGKAYTDYLFGETGATISGKVYVETSGTAPEAAPGLEGVEVRLVDKSGDPAWCAARADKCVTKTKADGSYAFEGVPPGTYDVVKNQNQLTEYYTGKGKDYTDGIETAGKADGTVENRYFGTQPGYNTIGSIVVTPEKIAAHSGQLSGYMFGVRQGSGSQGLVPPIVNGYVYMDHSHDRVRDPMNTDGQHGWTVRLSTSTGQEICTVQTNADGFYQFDNLHCPGHETGLPTSDSLNGATFNIHFAKDGNVLPSMASSGDGAGTAGGGQITGLKLKAADQVVEQNLPLDPEGVVYDAVTRKPVAGAVVGITFNGSGVFDPSTHLVGGASFQNQTTGTDGRYSFILQNNYPSGEYVLTIQSAPAAYLPGQSVMIPACVNTLNVTMLPGGVPALIQGQRDAPGLSQVAHDPLACPATPTGFASAAPFAASQQSTQYYLRFNITRGGSSEILNNHIPLDPVLAGGAILVTKTTPKVNVAKGDLVPYTITATNMSGGALANVRVRDLLPPGFRYRKGSATWNKMPVEPEVNGRELTWPNQGFATNEKKTYQLLLVVGAGVGEGEYVNQAWALNSQVNERISNVASALVRVTPDPTFDCSDLIGKVFDDKNANGYQDQGEPGIPNVRVVTARGLLVTTDADGRFHVACAAIPQADRGSNFVMKLDERTLPSGYRMTTENPRDVRVTRGKMVKLNFGATVHKVLRLEVDGRAFADDGKQLSAQWDEQIAQLLTQLAERPTVLRIAYRMTGEDKGVAEQRLKALTQRIQDGYAQQAQQKKQQEDDTPPLVIETESFEQSKAEGVR
ncbi:MAG: DUF11 domain-containing protein [Acidovorax sp.]|nr:DUF11 domain-containing protein [Acidovorax sp.]